MVCRWFQNRDSSCRGCKCCLACKFSSFVHFFGLGKETLPRTERERTKSCDYRAVLPSTAWNRHSKPRGRGEQWGMIQTPLDERCALDFRFNQFRSHRFGHLQKQALQNTGGLDRSCTVRSANDQTTSSVSTIPVMSENCAWHVTPLTSWNSCFWCRECGSREVQHQRHECGKIAFIQACALQDYRIIYVQTWKIEHDSKIAQKLCLNTASEAATEIVREEDILDAMKAARSAHLLPDSLAIQEALLQDMESVRFVYNEDIEMHAGDKSYREVRIFERALIYYCAIISMIHTTSKKLESATKMSITPRTQMLIASCGNFLEARKLLKYIFCHGTFCFPVAAFLWSYGRVGGKC